MNRISIDIETLGTNVDSQILSIGACAFNLKGEILATLHAAIRLEADEPVNATLGTVKFWLQQAAENPSAVADAMDQALAMDMRKALELLASLIGGYPDAEVWANGTKFDLGMLECQYKRLGIPIPWGFNADRCMRTLRMLAFNSVIFPKVDYEGTAHNALHDAIWQAKYIASCLTQLEVDE